MSLKDTVKPWFETGDKPTQAQFYTLFDSIRWNDEAIAIGDIIGLVAALLGKVNTSDYEGQLISTDVPITYTLPAGYLLERVVAFYGSGSTNMQISKVSMGATDLIDKDDVVAGWNQPIDLNIFAPVNTDIYIDGIPAASKIVILKRKIKIV
jgi:hypothetical protein